MQRDRVLSGQIRKQRVNFAAGEFFPALMHFLRIISKKCEVFRKNNKIRTIRLDCLLN